MIILDSSAALRCSLPQIDKAESVAFRRVVMANECVSPVLFLSEISNAVWKEVRFRDLKKALAVEIISSISKMTTLHFEDDLLISAAFEIALDAEHPVYDCIYIAMSRHYNAPILTADRKLQRKFSDDKFVELGA